MAKPRVEIVHPFTACARQFHLLEAEAEYTIGFSQRIENLHLRNNLDQTFVAMAAKIAPLALGHVGDFLGIEFIKDGPDGDEVEIGRWLDLQLSKPCIEMLSSWFDHIESNNEIQDARDKMAYVILSWFTSFCVKSDEDSLREVVRGRLERLIRETAEPPTMQQRS